MIPRVFLLAIVLLLVAHTSLGQDNPGPPTEPPTVNIYAEENALLEEAFKLLDKNEIETGMFLLNAIIAGYSESDAVRAACLTLADSYYDAGGSELLARSEVLYSQWLSLKPNDENADKLLYRLAEMRLRTRFDRDGDNYTRAENPLQTLLERFPKSTLKPQAEVLLYKVQEKLGDSNLAVARFYFENRGAMAGAEDRLKVILENYKHYSKTDEVLFLLGKTELAREEFEESGKFLRLLIEKYPNSRNTPAACELLGNYGEVLPETCR